MKQLFVFIVSMLLTSNLVAQLGMGQWRLHVANRKAVDVVAGNNLVFTAFQDGLLEYDIAHSESNMWTAVNGLSDLSLTCLGYYPAQNAVFVGYENGNIDKIVNNTVTNIPAIRLAQVPGSKRINKIVEFENYLYVATGFSIVKIDPVKNEVKDTYYPTDGAIPLIDVAFHNDSIFALTDTAMYKGKRSSFALADPTQWVVDGRLPTPNPGNTYREIETVANQLYLLRCNAAYGLDSVFAIKDGGLEWASNEPYSLEMHSISNSNGKLAVNMDGGVYTYNADYSHYSTATSSLSKFVNNSYSYNGSLWMADNAVGLIQFKDGTATNITFPGPAKNSFYSMDCQKGKLVVTGGGLNAAAMTYNSAGISIFEDEAWQGKDAYNTSPWTNDSIFDFLVASLHPSYLNTFAVGTFSPTPLSIFEDGKTVINTFTKFNSPLEKTMWNQSVMVNALQYDATGNLWIGNGYCTNPLKVYTKDKSWYTFELGSYGLTNKSIERILIDFQGNKWLAVKGAGIIALNDNQTVANPSDDKIKKINTGATTGNLPSNEVKALAVDFDNNIWIGTESGFAILYNSSSVFDATAGNYNAQRIKVDFEGNVEYLLGSTSITDIEVDGGNRKWIGTENAGLFLLSKDGSEIVASFTAENSPLISNNIMELEFNHTTGELFIITDRGMVSYRVDATYEDAEYANVSVFPNPVRPDFFGPITIQGIRYDSDIHVTDAAGNVVYKTTSHGGTATWNGKTLQGERAKSGVYLFWTATNEGKGRKVGKVVLIQ
jgi:hypothetical protein